MITNTRRYRNAEIRDYAREKGVFLWEIAEKYHMTDTKFSIFLRRELTDEEKKECISIIDSIAETE